MPDSFGARLRQQREERGIALEAIAKQTRIKESLLEALERDDLSQWPTGFYRRAFFRAYAGAIALDVDAAYREFQDVYPEPPEVDVLIAMAATLGRGDNGPSAALRGAVGSALSRLRRSSAMESTPPSPAETATPAASGERFEPPAETNSSCEAGPPPSASAPGDPLPSSPPPEPDPGSRSIFDPAMPAVGTVTAPGTQEELLEVARLCTELARVATQSDAQPLLHDAARRQPG
jgi:transcriptional regulator with XRE-family HTH domain